MSRRKGERPVPRPLQTWSPSHPVARTMASGSRWFDAWIGQMATPLTRLSKLSGIPVARLWTLCQGGQVSRAEIDGLARAWSISSADLIASLPDPAMLAD